MVTARSAVGSNGRIRVAERERVRSKVGRRAVMEGDPWFASLPLSVRDQVFDHARLRWVNNGHVLFTTGQAPDHWHGVVFGSVKLRSVSPDGRESVAGLIGPGGWFGDLSIIDGLPRMHDAIAHGRTALLSLTGDELMALIHREAEFARALLRLQGQRMRQLFLAIEEANTLSVDVRLARHLSGLAHTYGCVTDAGTQLRLHLPQDCLGQMLGVSRQRINQTLKAWERLGVLSQRYGRITIADMPMLEALGAPSCPLPPRAPAQALKSARKQQP